MLRRRKGEDVGEAIQGALEAALSSPDAEAEFDRFQTRLIAQDDTVRSGPFEGMRLVAQESWVRISSYLLGSYERELHPALEQLLAEQYDTVVDVGCAEGYYAVGLARRLPTATVHAFDTDERARSICSRMATVNDVAARVIVGGTCDPAQLDELLTRRTLVFVDCEGCETHLLDPNQAPGLVDADLIVELHDFIDPRISERILGRFAPTHDVEIVETTSRSADDYAELAEESAATRFLALWEGRPTEPHPMQWAILRARRR